MIHKSIYIISTLSIIALTFMTKEMLPLIYQARWQGLLYLSLLLVLLILHLIIFIRYTKVLKNLITYHILVIFITTYMAMIYYKIYSIGMDGTFLYNIDLTYCQNNYLLMSVALLFMIGSLVMIFFEQKEEKSL